MWLRISATVVQNVSKKSLKSYQNIKESIREAKVDIMANVLNIFLQQYSPPFFLFVIA